MFDANYGRFFFIIFQPERRNISLSSSRGHNLMKPSTNYQSTITYSQSTPEKTLDSTIATSQTHSMASHMKLTSQGKEHNFRREFIRSL